MTEADVRRIVREEVAAAKQEWKVSLQLDSGGVTRADLIKMHEVSVAAAKRAVAERDKHRPL